MREEEQKLQMVALARSLFERGYSVGGAGNLSVRLDRERILVTPTGASLGRLQAERLAVVDMRGNLLSGDKPSKESVFHLAIYRNNPACGAIVHLHSTYLTALSCLQGLDPDNAIRAFTPYYVMRVGKLAVVPYYPPGDGNIARELGERANRGKAFLLANHGVVVCGENLVDALENTEELEETAKLYFILQGHKIRYLTAAEIKDLEHRGK
ncbi:ribulose-5-phosphate 4-epimerase/fuculose-1-phosphate aldolase [Mesocricetibacter intestinalis]|uniref:3-oxo-tetronate 4-phosphate decarboxylase n=1 Tax=Mesocricetibacter intestinalis TaxID=1521930 RepID=A0A4R6VEV7_9PAST|nr:aldolase [Mesocricetibacter intestinalis]TDQ59382.1 ribulose-5-phosphate 4-epimerase/fuculose-1-phosphate aldolase [Mesocricetibacter intestinalis]